MQPSKSVLPLVLVVCGALALSPIEPKPASAGSGSTVAGAVGGFVMGVIVGRATANKSPTYRSSGSSKSYSSSRSSGGSTRYVRDDATLQKALNAFGHNAGSPDGVFGPKTQSAIKSYQASLGDTQTGTLTAQQRAQLLADYSSLVNRNNNNNNNNNDDNGNGTPNTKTAAADDFLQRLRQQNSSAQTDTPTTGPVQNVSDRPGDAAPVVTVSFDELCSPYVEQSNEGRVIDVGFKTESNRGGSLLMEQLCTSRSYALQNLESDLAELGNLDVGEANEQCSQFTATQVEALTDIAKAEPEATVAAFEEVFGDVGDQRDPIVRSTRVCLGLAYAFDNPQGAIVTAASLTALGEGGYGELIGEHLATGLGIDRNPKLAAEWMDWAATAIDDGAKPVVDVEGYDRAPLLRVLAEVAGESGMTQTADTRGPVRSGGLLLPGIQPADRNSEAVAFFASESVAMIKSLETMLLAIGLDRPALETSCAAGEDIAETLSIRVCRALAYANLDFEAMYRFDQLLAETNDTDSQQRLAVYEDLTEQGLSKLVATTE
jgi:Putative peptidoglycan binding domain